MVTIEKRQVQNTGRASLGWHLGYGYVNKTLTFKRECWCVIDDGQVMAECRSKKAAEKILEAFDWVGHTG